MSTVDAALRRARLMLASSSESASLDAELLLAHVLGTPRAQLQIHPERPLAAAQTAEFAALLQRRAAGEPVAYLLGSSGFWTLDLQVTPAVLVPRPATELLVDLALRALRDRESPRLLDLGTGSGAIAIALATERRDARIDAVDSSAAALAVASDNAARLAVTNVHWRQGSWWIPVAGQRYALIVANPPYLSAADPHLAALRHEPREALVAGPTGLEDLETIIAGAMAHLDPGGTLLVEHGYEQGPAVRRLFDQAGFQEVATARDLAGHERTTGGRATG